MSEWKCEVIRDLMPLVADDVASEESKRLVKEHVECCEQCRQLYERMASGLPKPSETAESETKFIQFCRKLHRRMSLQKWLAVLLAALVIAYGSWTAYHNICTDTVEMPTNWVSLSLSRSEDGSVLETYAMKDGHVYANAGFTGYYDHGIRYIAPNKYVWQIGWYDGALTEFHRNDDFVIKENRLYEVYYEDSVYEKKGDQRVETWNAHYTPISELRLGTEQDYVVVWKEGDEIPLVENSSDAE